MEHAIKPGVFITVEGVEGVGKSSAVAFIRNYLADKVDSVVFTREPGGTIIAEQIREILLKPNAKEALGKKAEILLMFAGRAEHLEKVIVPALQRGKWVVCDRFVDASYAYQGYGREMDLEKVSFLDQWIVGDYEPHLTILLDAPVELGLARAKNRGPQDRIEQEEIDFFERVRLGYLERAKANPNRFVIIDAVQSMALVHENIRILLESKLSEKL